MLGNLVKDGATNMSARVSVFQKLLLKWKSLQLPWRKQWLVGKASLQDNS
jgi:hypothetical protein